FALDAHLLEPSIDLPAIFAQVLCGGSHIARRRFENVPQLARAGALLSTGRLADPCLWKRWQGVGCTGIAGRDELGMHVHQHLLFDGSSDCERRGAVHDALKPTQIVWPIMSEQQLGSVGCKGGPGRMLRLTRVLTLKIAHPIQ